MASTSQKLRVVVAGASGETGQSVMNGLLSEPEKFDVTVLGRPESLSKDVYNDLAKRGAAVTGVDFTDIGGLTSVLEGVSAVICCVTLEQASVQEALLEASKKAGVARFIPSFWATICPPRGVMRIRAMKEELLDKCKAIYQPYTVIDVGWWYQFSMPRVPSGKLDSAITFPENTIAGDGNLQSALTDKEDVGKFVARIISDPRTINKQVFAYGEVTTQNKIYAAVEKYTGETIPREYISKEQIEKSIADAAAAFAANPANPAPYVEKSMLEYKWSRWNREDNTPEHADYLSYLNAKELYPDLQPKSMDDFVHELVEGRANASLYAGQDKHALKGHPNLKI
ncbi:hypothetical protein ACKAV7_008390 [Fusarium commune]